MSDDTPQRLDHLEGALLHEVRGMRKDLRDALISISEMRAYQTVHHERLTALEQGRADGAARWGSFLPQVVSAIVSSVLTAAILGGLAWFLLDSGRGSPSRQEMNHGENEAGRGP